MKHNTKNIAAKTRLLGKPAAIKLGIILTACMGILNVVCIIGASYMIGGKSYKYAMISMIVSCVPCLSGCVILGIPFGIWGLVVLCQEDVKQAFRNKASQ